MAKRWGAAIAGAAAVVYVPELGVPGAGPVFALGGGDDLRDGAQEGAVEARQWRRQCDGSCALLRDQVGEQRIPLRGGGRCGFAGAGDLIVAARGALFGGGFRLRFPVGLDQLVAFQAAQRGIDGAAGQAGGLHHVEAEAVAEAERLEDEGGGVGEARRVHGSCTAM